MDGRKRLSGAQYKKNARLKLERELKVLSATNKIDSFFVKPNTSASADTSAYISISPSIEIVSQCEVDDSDKGTFYFYSYDHDIYGVLIIWYWKCPILPRCNRPQPFTAIGV